MVDPHLSEGTRSNHKVVEDIGERGRNRTFNLLIKSTWRTKNQQFSDICTD